MTILDLAHLLHQKTSGELELGSARMVLFDILGGFWGIYQQMEALIGEKLSASVLRQAGANGGASFAQKFLSADDLGSEIAFKACLQAYATAGFGSFDISSINWQEGRIQISAQNAFEAWMHQQNGDDCSSPMCSYTAGVLVGFMNIISGRSDLVCVEHSCQACGDEHCTFELMPADQAMDHEVITYSTHPELGRNLNLLEVLFERMPMGIAIFDLDYRLVRFNPTWAEFIDQYTPSTQNDVQPGVSLFDLAPDADIYFKPIFEQVLCGQPVQIEGFKSVSKGIISYWDVVFSPLYENGKIVGVLDVTTDATERIQNELQLQETLATLEQRVEERTREVTSLLEASRELNTTLDVSALLEKILDEIRKLVPYSGASLMVIEGDELVVLAHNGPIPQNKITGLRFPFQSSKANLAVLESSEPAIIPDTRADTPLAQAFRETASDQLDSMYGYIHSWMGVPLLARGEVIGMLSLDHTDFNFYTQDHAALALAFANQAATGIENARLYQEGRQQYRRAERRRKSAESLRDILHSLNSTEAIEKTLKLIVKQANQLMESSACLLHQINYETQFVEISASTGLPQELKNVKGFPLFSSVRSDTRILERKPVWIPDLNNRPGPTPEQLDPTIRDWRARSKKYFHAWLAVPLIVRDEVFGSLAFYFSEPRDLVEEDISLASSYANQAALAIENASLRAHVEQAAVLAERNRLARDLHDAVTQTLFSSSLIAEVLPKIWENNPEAGRQRLEELRRLTKGALSEMRTLLLELRPTALADTDLNDLLSHQVNAFLARTMIQVDYTHLCKDTPPVNVKEMFYRIAQECLNNISKHADAKAVSMHLVCQSGTVELIIEDDGIGFLPEDQSTEGLGLGIMRERAAAIGAVLEIASRIDEGTRVSLVWKNPGEEKENNG